MWDCYVRLSPIRPVRIRTKFNSVPSPRDSFKPVTSNVSAGQQHKTTVANSMEPMTSFQCYDCKVMFKYPSELQKHMKVGCFGSQHLLQDHYDSHFKKEHRYILKPDQFGHSGKRTAPLSKAFDKFGTTSSGNPYRHGLSDERCAQSYSLTEPFQTHIYEKPFSCKKCHERFDQSAVLKIHMKTHTGYACMICDEKFTVTTSLEEHMNIHTEEKTYSCHICGKVFMLSYSLMMHMATHYKNGFSCDFCNERKSVRSAVNLNMFFVIIVHMVLFLMNLFFIM